MIRLAVRVRRERAELVLAELLELAPDGLEEVAVDAHTVEYAVYGSPGELPTLPALRAATADALLEISTRETADDWQERWKRFHHPVLVDAPRVSQGARSRARALHVRAPWQSASGLPAGSVEEVVIDPGQAFGTGSHASTRLCLELLLELRAREPRVLAVLDVGTGSGVLAIAAARLGFAPVVGIDHDRASVHAAGENAAVNGVECDVRRLDLRRDSLPWVGQGESDARAKEARQRLAPSAKTAGVVLLANLLRPLLLDLAHVIDTAPAHLLAGGLLSDQVDEIVRVFHEQLGLREQARRAHGEWSAVWLLAD